VPAHGLEQHRGAGDVDVGVTGQVGEVHAEPDQGGLMADRVGSGQRLVHRDRVADVADHQVGGHVVRPAAMDGRRERVHASHLMAGRADGLRDMRSDKAGRTGHQNTHDCRKACKKAKIGHPADTVTAS